MGAAESIHLLPVAIKLFSQIKYWISIRKKRNSSQTSNIGTTTHLYDQYFIGVKDLFS
jgi:hypothetical protein